MEKYGILVIAIAAAGKQELALAYAGDLGGDGIGKANRGTDDLTILDAAIHLQMLVVGHPLDLALAAKVEMNIKHRSVEKLKKRLPKEARHSCRALLKHRGRTGSETEDRR